MIYAIDFDGTIVENSFPNIGRLNQSAFTFIKQLEKRGDKWVLWTMREGDRLKEAVSFLESIGLSPDAVNDNIEELKRDFGNNPRKVFANVYIDDHNAGGLRFEEPVKDQGKVK